MQAFLASGLQSSSARDRIRSSHRYTFAPCLWAQSATTIASIGTQIFTLGIPDDFYAVRVGFLNINPAPYTVSKIVAVPSTTWSNYVKPTGSAGQTILTTNAAGANDDRIYWKSTGNLTSLTVAGNITDPVSGITDKAVVTWTDWTPCASTTPDPITGMRVLMLRASIPASQTITFCNGTLNAYSGGVSGSYEVNGGMDCFIGGIKTQDRTSFPYSSDDFLPSTTATYFANGIGNGNLFAIVQVLTKNEGFTIAQIGESKFLGTGTKAGINNWVLRSVAELNKQYIGTMPVGYCGFAVGGYDSAHTLGFSRDALAAINPGIVNICSWNGNEDNFGLGYPDLASQQIQFARTLAFVDFVRSVGAVPVLNSPIPCVQFNAKQLPNQTTSSLLGLPGYQAAFAAWKSITASGMVPVFDLYKYLGADWNAMSPNYVNGGISDDGDHPNDIGNILLVQPFLNFVSSLLGNGI